MDRRRFLLLFGGTSTGLVLAGSGLIALPERMAILAGGRCSFCLGTIPSRAIAGMIGQPHRICDACTAFFHNLIHDDWRGARTVLADGAIVDVEGLVANARRASVDATAFARLRASLHAGEQS